MEDIDIHYLLIVTVSHFKADNILCELDCIKLYCFVC